MICLKCGNENADGALFCSECGAAFSQDGQKCPDCGKVFEGAEKYCSQCGYALERNAKVVKILNGGVEDIPRDSKVGEIIQTARAVDWDSGIASVLAKGCATIFVLGLCALIFWGVWILARWTITKFS